MPPGSSQTPQELGFQWEDPLLSGEQEPQGGRAVTGTNLAPSLCNLGKTPSTPGASISSSIKLKSTKLPYQPVGCEGSGRPQTRQAPVSMALGNMGMMMV